MTKGEITFAGKNLLALDPPDRVRLGLAHVLEGRRVFVHLTPRENLLAATSMHHDRAHISRLDRAHLHLVSRVSLSAPTLKPAICRAASSRCSRSAAR